MTIIPDALDDSATDKPRPAPHPLRIPEAVPALEEVRPPASPTPNEIIRRAYESLP